MYSIRDLDHLSRGLRTKIPSLRLRFLDQAQVKDIMFGNLKFRESPTSFKSTVYSSCHCVSSSCTFQKLYFQRTLITAAASFFCPLDQPCKTVERLCSSPHLTSCSPSISERIEGLLKVFIFKNNPNLY